MITRIEACNYRCFQHLAVEMSEQNVLAGPNGSGKTTLLDIPRLVGDFSSVENASTAFLAGQRGEEWARARSLGELIYKQQGTSFSFAVEARLPGEIRSRVLQLSPGQVKNYEERQPTHLRYEVSFQVFNETELHIASENLFLFPGAHTPPRGKGLVGDRTNLKHVMKVLVREGGAALRLRPEGRTGDDGAQTTTIEPYRAGLSVQPFDMSKFPALVWFQGFIRKQTLCYRPDWRKLRTPCPPGMKTGLLPSAWNLPWLVLDIMEQDEADRKHAVEFTEGDLSEAPAFYPRIQDWVTHLRTGLPQIESVSAATSPADSHAYLEITYKGGHVVRSSGLSEGTDNILAFTILPHLLNKPESMVVEEPENGIHPRGIHTVLEALGNVKGSQVWISTHSPIVVANTELKNLILLRQDKNGAATAISGADHPRTRDWKGKINLGDLYAAGVLS